MSDHDRLQRALITFLVIFTGAAGIGCLVWMAVVLVDMVHTLLLTAGGVGISVALRKGGKR